MMNLSLMTYLKIAAVILLLSLTGRYLYLEKQNANLKVEKTALQNNLDHYIDQKNGLDSVGHVLRLSVDDLRHSNDSVVQSLQKEIKGLKIDLKSVKSSTIIDQHVEYNGKDKIIFKDSCNFSYTDTLLLIKSKGLTSLHIDVKGDSIKTNLTIDNKISVINYVKKEWEEPKFFKRLFTFNWKKRQHDRFVSINTNPIIHNEITSIEVRKDNE